MPWDEDGGLNSCPFWGHKGLDAHSMFIAIKKQGRYRTSAWCPLYSHSVPIPHLASPANAASPLPWE